MSYQLNFGALLDYQDVLLDGLWMTVKLTLISTVLGILLGVLGAAARRHRNAALRHLSKAYVELIRNTPFIVQLFFVFFGLPAIGIKMTAIEAGVLALVINLGAYLTEIIRAGIDATPKGQLEAARTLGLSSRQIFIRIVLPPAFQRVYSAVVSQCIIVMLGSAVVSQISVPELTFAANFIQSRNFLSFESYLVAALFYLILAFLMRLAFNLIGARAFSRKEKTL
ncbi:amino acid ABC transporter, permease protein [Marinobacterium lacunae]|uniref:Amino acid ABC transporter, permease protein n=1 Tax=Marinobacterium lacunae TaxID=1232683 RepID=A0A081G4D2_9GAMM|nr:amino acid ABC transporter permease [Marinobacterium lacunae]KEA65637.1 amino acid ABC transporter, permease protein [Marinobacterium lacunae]MBR9884358.1 amino acid ABC transporter permease [Oceanospirillales bacterium]